MIIGDRKSRKNLKEDAEKNPLTINGKKMKEVTVIKFLGDLVSNSAEESVHQTVTKRIGIAKQAVFEIRSVIEDRRAQSIGGINLAFEIFNASVLGMLLHNCETWDSIPKKTMKILNDLYLLFFRTIFRIGNGAPIVNFFWETGTMKPKFLILQRTLRFIFHLANQSDKALSKQILKREISENIPGIYAANKHHLDKINFEAMKYLSK